MFAAVAKAGLALRELRREQPSLEDGFASLTTVEPASDDPATDTSDGAATVEPTSATDDGDEQ